MASRSSDGLMGAFVVMGPKGTALKIISSGTNDEFGWEHVSVTCEHRTPNWFEMCWVKDLFWKDEETVVQYHPAKSEYVNCHPFCLHLWRPNNVLMPTPPSLLVGPLSGNASKLVEEV
jgi:hypothetical protein